MKRSSKDCELKRGVKGFTNSDNLLCIPNCLMVFLLFWVPGMVGLFELRFVNSGKIKSALIELNMTRVTPPMNNQERKVYANGMQML